MTDFQMVCSGWLEEVAVQVSSRICSASRYPVKIMPKVNEDQSTLCVGAALSLIDLIVDGEEPVRSKLQSTLSAESLKVDEIELLWKHVDESRNSIGRWRRRERGMASILAGVRELAELRDVDTLLDRLVDRARALLNADVAYLTEYRGDHLKVRTTSGVVTVELRDLFVPAGMGLASKVVSSHRPQWTSTYEHLNDVPHDRIIDDAVTAEGLVSLLGVPLLAGDEILGALFAANRTVYEFSPDEIALLGAFADHAAVVLQTARLLENAQEQAYEAKRANDVLTNNLLAMERASAVHEDLTAVVVRGGSATEIAATLGMALGRRIVIVDRDWFVVAETSSAGSDLNVGQRAQLSEAVEDAITRNRRTGMCVSADETDFECAVAVGSEDTFLGALIVGPGDIELGGVERRTVERAAQITALVALKQDAIDSAANRLDDELVSDLLNPRTKNQDTLRKRARGLRFNLDKLQTLIVVSIPQSERRGVLNALRRTRPESLVGEEGGALVVLSTDDDSMDIAARIERTIASVATSQASAVVAPPFLGFEQVPVAFETALRCTELLSNLNSPSGVFDARAYEPYMAMFDSSGAKLTGFIDSVIGPVLRWDEKHAANLIGTLRFFIETQSSPTRTARELHIHVNTVLQRLERITKLLGPNWRQSEPMFRIGVAIRMHTIASRPSKLKKDP